MKSTLQKNMNNNQRKMLDKIYSPAMNEKINHYNKERSEKLQTLREVINKKITAQNKVAMKKLEDSINAIQKIAKKLYSEGVKVTVSKEGSQYGGGIDINGAGTDFVVKMTDISARSYCNDTTEGVNKEVQKFNQATKESVRKLEELKMEMQADIYGLQVSYDEIRKELDRRIKAISLA